MPRMLRAALLVAANDLRRRLRNRSFVIQALVGPVVLASVISAAFSGGFGFDVEIGVVNQDRSELSESIERGLVEGGAEDVAFTAADDVAAATPSGRGRRDRGGAGDPGRVRRLPRHR